MAETKNHKRPRGRTPKGKPNGTRVVISMNISLAHKLKLYEMVDTFESTTNKSKGQFLEELIDAEYEVFK